MSSYEVKEDALYYKSMRLKSAQLVVEVKEAADYSYTDNKTGERKDNFEPAIVNIFHSPAKFPLQDKFKVCLKNRGELKEYIAMLVDFEQRFGDFLDQVQKPERKIEESMIYSSGDIEMRVIEHLLNRSVAECALIRKAVI